MHLDITRFGEWAWTINARYCEQGRFLLISYQLNARAGFQSEQVMGNKVRRLPDVKYKSDQAVLRRGSAKADACKRLSLRRSRYSVPIGFNGLMLSTHLIRIGGSSPCHRTASLRPGIRHFQTGASSKPSDTVTDSVLKLLSRSTCSQGDFQLHTWSSIEVRQQKSLRIQSLAGASAKFEMRHHF